jgi:hypothetical protein
MCDSGWHIKSLPEPLSAVPERHWTCPNCHKAGVTPAQLLSKVRERELRQQLDGKLPQLYPEKAMRGRDAAAQALHGRLLLQNFDDPATGRERPYWGRLHYMGAQRRPEYFDVHFDDGEVYNYTMAEAKAHLQPPHVVLPAGMQLPGDDKLRLTGH